MRFPAVVLALLAVVVVVLQGRGSDSSAASADAVVRRVVDGDTVVLSGIGKARLIRIGTPEVYAKVEFDGPAAWAYTNRVLPHDARVHYRLGVEPRDRY